MRPVQLSRGSSEAVRDTSPGPTTAGTRSTQGDGENWRQRSPAAAATTTDDRSRTVQGHRDFTADEVERQNCDEGRRGLGTQATAAAASVPRRHHSMTSLLATHRNTCPRPQPDDVISATLTQAVTSSGGGGQFSRLQGLQRQELQTTPDDTCCKTSLAKTIDSDQSRPATNRLTTPTVPLPQTPVIDDVRKPVERSTQTRSVHSKNSIYFDLLWTCCATFCFCNFHFLCATL